VRPREDRVDVVHVESAAVEIRHRALGAPVVVFERLFHRARDVRVLAEVGGPSRGARAGRRLDVLRADIEVEVGVPSNPISTSTGRSAIATSRWTPSQPFHASWTPPPSRPASATSAPRVELSRLVRRSNTSAMETPSSYHAAEVSKRAARSSRPTGESSPVETFG